MKRPIFVCPLSDADRETLEAGLRSPDAFTLRRCQILLASSRGENAYRIAHELGCNPQTARNAIHAFNEKGLPQALRQGSKRPHTVHRAFQGPERVEALRELLHHTPREYGKDRACGRWTWPPRSASKKALPKDASRERPSGRRLRGWGYVGSEPSGGSLPRIPSTQEKKAARPIDRLGRGPPRVGRGFSGRELVQPPGATRSGQLERSGRAPAPGGAIGRKRRPRSEGHLLLRALCAGAREGVGALRGWEAR